MPYANTPEGEIFYAVRGQAGPVVVFVHGAGGSHLIWNAQLAALAGIARAYALDLPGHGRSGPPGRRRIGDYAASVAAFLDALAVERAVVVGHSMGGATAQMMALEYPSRVAGLGLVGTGARLRVLPAFIEGVLSDNANTCRQVSEVELAPDAEPRLRQLNEQAMRDCDPQVFQNDFKACDEFDIMQRLGQITAPTLVLCGDQDRMTPPKYSEYLAAHIPHAELEIIPGAGHMVMLEKPEEVSRALARFLQQVEEHPAS